MKKRLFLPVIILTLLSTVGIRAQSTYTPGDAYLFFLAQGGTGSGKNVQIDLGNLTSTSFSGFNFSSATLSSVLGSTYGASWYNLNTVSWGLIGSANSLAVDAATIQYLGVTMGLTGANAANPALDVNALYSIGGALDPMNNAGQSGTATKGTIADNNGVNHFYTIYDNSISGSASAQDANAFGALSGALSGAVTTFSSNAINFYAVGDDGTGTPIATTVTQTGTFSVSSGAISIAAYSLAPSGTNVWSSNSGNLSAIGITNTQNLIFSGAGGSVTNDQVSSLTGITFSNTVSSGYTLSGAAITNGASGIVNNSASAQTISAPITLGAAQTFNAASGDITISGAITNAGNTLTISGSKNTTLSGAISGVGGLSMIGAGTTTLSAASTFGGTTTVSSGTLLISGYGNTNSAVTIGSGAVLKGINAGGPAALGAVTVQNGGTLAPGNVDGKLYVQSINLASNSLSAFDIQSTNAFSSINSSGSMVLGGALTLAIQGAYNNTNNQGLFQLFTSGAGITGNFTSVTLTGAYTGSLSYYAVNNSWQLWSGSGASSYYAGLNLNTGLMTVVPEPSTYALFGLGSLALLVAARRRKHSQLS